MKTKWGNANLDGNGYYIITTEKEGNCKKFLHRLIWEEAHGPIPDGYVIHHIDKNKTNNNISNLQCLTQFEHKSIHSKEQWHGENNYMAKLTEKDVKLILRMLRTGNITQTRMAEIMGVYRSAISKIKHKQRWSHVSI
jgi:predicted XRE-type DNA-binding protein